VSVLRPSKDSEISCRVFSAWTDIDVFSDGHDYEFALGGGDLEYDEEQPKPELRYSDVRAIVSNCRNVFNQSQVFEPSEIRARPPTEYDNLIRVQDIPECEHLKIDKAGADVDRAVTDPYYHLLPFVCGLGPRVKDPLDNPWIRSEDYELTRKMATDTLGLDEEDVHDEHPSYVVSLIMQDPDNERKLSELNLDEFAISMYEANEDRKRHTLNVIREELLRPFFAEKRSPFPPIKPWEALTMLSGETPQTLGVGLIISVLVVGVKDNFVYVRLDSGIDGVIDAQYLTDQGAPPKEVVKKGQRIQGVIIDVKLNLLADQFLVELSSRPHDMATGDADFRLVRPDEHWNTSRADRDTELLARKKRAEVDKTRRVIKHPNFHNFNSAQAETYLEKQQRGDVVIRPSSKGIDHLAVTWKVDDNLYQHIGMS
jgi:hypothetical protein